MGRTARGIDGKGHALLILRPEELGFLRFLKQAKVTIKDLLVTFPFSEWLLKLRFASIHQVPLSEFEFSWSKIADIQSQVRFPLRQLQDVSVNELLFL